ncbi:hypothetical protein NIES2135_61520 (plasmid) [Leptolyngbya boryana NIES-2135]|jgi:hypothetical protein|uniref:Uncharacterized protein n=1 Tax=Leptolyngbya boryana NIES-2135 TaxID=1973484 RepID=A0A1Z4JR86_LEPBY|nr:MULTISPECIES: hypothetical protein [Leptolyngbya]BAY59275.1 hypothetical protein NIES2135_61520 [Leptolyngbya boryana NIES-2135]MBD2372863.1 hypothetical protein [Leptolyngbya sp. FACHB-238]MBD2397384.1 hypothetical protein [Leptolyngbya sp. FACHB-239]MBD2403811.1 hypothetical protein [Leptolyngbya sp. FACHB-402]ULP33467.1 hypothetical protein MCP04_30525 [Leptolyngbya boryana IU 594]
MPKPVTKTPLDLDCIDFGSLVRVHPMQKQLQFGQIYQFVGAVVEVRDNMTRTLCRFLSTTSSDYFVLELGDVAEWINAGWLSDADAETFQHTVLLTAQ